MGHDDGNKQTIRKACHLAGLFLCFATRRSTSACISAAEPVLVRMRSLSAAVSVWPDMAMLAVIVGIMFMVGTSFWLFLNYSIFS